MYGAAGRKLRGAAVGRISCGRYNRMRPLDTKVPNALAGAVTWPDLLARRLNRGYSP